MFLCDYLCLCVFTWQKIDQTGGPETFNFVWPYIFLISYMYKFLKDVNFTVFTGNLSFMNIILTYEAQNATTNDPRK